MIKYQTVNVPPGHIGLILEYSMAGKRGTYWESSLTMISKKSQSTVNLSFVLESLYGNIDKFNVFPNIEL